MTTKIFIDGEAGTTGLQIRERLEGRTDLELLLLGDDKRKDLAARKDALNSADVAILCLPDDAARESVSLIENTTTRVIDASTAHRVAEGWAYGFAEMDQHQTQEIANARFVSNPGCWPQGYIAAIRPLVQAGIVPAEFAASYHGISGYTGGGKQMIADYENDSLDLPEFVPYALKLKHKHIPEMTKYAGLTHQPIFQPAVGKFSQGMVGITPLALWSLPKKVGGADIQACLADFYQGRTYVTIEPLGDYDKADDVTPEIYRNTNEMHLTVFANDETGDAMVFAVYDNLGKGASGAAVQNLNIMLGLPETTGLR